ncbi:MAG: toprim domain-containing protein [Sutterellaceae bacterium]|nr:toprim domain-containing protein [Sutterellaceae bacterium]
MGVRVKNEHSHAYSDIQELLEPTDSCPQNIVNVNPANPLDESSKFDMPNFIALPVNGRNLKYLTNRGISHEATAYFRLGFCPDGLFRYKKIDGSLAYLDFAMRVIVPIFDMDGKLVSFQGRDITGQAEKKYLCPHGIRSTGAYFFNGHNARGAQSIVITEGVFDVIATWQAVREDPELRDVVPVGSLGKYLSEALVGYLLKLKDLGLQNITLMWDGEDAAIADAIATGKLLQKKGFAVRIAILPGKDPNEVSPDVVREAYKTAEALPPDAYG